MYAPHQRTGSSFVSSLVLWRHAMTLYKYVQKFSKEEQKFESFHPLRVAGLAYEVGWKLAHKRGGSSLACACGLRLIDNVLCVSRPVIRIASSSLRMFSDRAHMAGTCSIVEYALRFVVARFVVDLLRRAIANLVAISGALGQIIISDIFIVRDWEHGQPLTIIRRIFLADVLDGTANFISAFS